MQQIIRFLVRRYPCMRYCTLQSFFFSCLFSILMKPITFKAMSPNLSCSIHCTPHVLNSILIFIHCLKGARLKKALKWWCVETTFSLSVFLDTSSEDLYVEKVCVKPLLHYWVKVLFKIILIKCIIVKFAVPNDGQYPASIVCLFWLTAK